MRKYVIMGIQGSGKGTHAKCSPRISISSTSRSGISSGGTCFQLVYAPDDERGLIPDVTTAAGLLTFALVLITVT
jgi:hypothetical protein